MSGLKENWTGRISNQELAPQYWHQIIQCNDINNLDNNVDIAIVGYVCDEGVKRNLGRVGAQNGPQKLREKLAKLPVHFRPKQIVDVGDVICVDNDMEACQNGLSIIITRLLENNIFPLVIGGGHDIAYGHFNGIREFIKDKLNTRIGIISFDAHFDLRPVENKPNSGTPFNQVVQDLKALGETLDYFVIGIQEQSNTKELFDIAKRENVDYVLSNQCEIFSDIETLKNKLEVFISNVDYIYLTIDMDCFSLAYAPGVSAPSPLGLTPQFVFKIITFLFQTKKMISCDIAELNPKVDFNNHTSILASRLLDFVATHIHI